MFSHVGCAKARFLNSSRSFKSAESMIKLNNKSKKVILYVNDNICLYLLKWDAFECGTSSVGKKMTDMN